MKNGGKNKCCVYNFGQCRISACISVPVVNQWLVVMERVHELTLQAVLWLWRGQELCWRILELHSFKLVSTGIIWVCVKEVRHKPVYSMHIVPGCRVTLN